ncbi:efflux RND transporter permease subunit [Pseudoalteromonas piratica]|uniref:Multidrug transporter AcrB n=1 Tax=Pseudoalteromonas piratica TaxID=1348114 RepID=A0A0A7EM48_9GAMM|nr:efflux RND transporter permease subunit [Pseudoalteromonas piratica]AIY67116.1 multidrug transporter AcrB [Pseudoalteromonas piratica]
MNIAQLSIEKRTISWLFTLILLFGGFFAYQNLGRLEDPEFTLKKAMIVTSYPGASPEQVEQEVTYPIENVIQQLPYVDYVTSISSPGLSQISVEMKSTYRKEALRQIWDELRRKINDLSPTLPAGVYPSKVMDDFGDVYGVLYAISGDDYSYEELENYVDYLRRELVLVEGVGKVTVAGEQKPQVIVEISSHKLAQLGMSANVIYQLLQNQNTVSNAGKVTLEGESIRLHPTGEFKDVSELEDLLISKPGAKEIIYLGDVATVKREYPEIPNNPTHYAGKRTLLLGVSFASGVNVVDIGDKLKQHLVSLEYQRPYGIEINTLYNQPKEVEKSVDDFITSLIQAVSIVIGVLLLFMGFRSGLLIGAVLLITVFGTFIFMLMQQIDLQRISLGALIIALGMLVDNAIVITEGILVGLKKGYSKVKAATVIIEQTKWPLLGATIIAITAFAPIGLSSDATGEFAGSLFYVLLISLLLSWITAITVTPFLASLLFKQSKNDTNTNNDVNADELYKGRFFVLYSKLLKTVLVWPKVTLSIMFMSLLGALVLFGNVKQSFFPPSNTPIFYLDYWRYQGSDIRATEQDITKLEQYLLSKPEVVAVTSTIGQGAPRFMLTYAPEKIHPAYGQLIIRTTNLESLNSLLSEIRTYASENLTNAFIKLKRMEIGPSTDAKIEARFQGSDPETLRLLANQAIAILKQDGAAHNIRHDWRELTKVIRPQFNEQKARRLGISKSDLDNLLLTTLSGRKVGLYREGTRMLPIIARSPASERLNVDSLYDLQIFSPTLGVYLPIEQIVDGFNTEWENNLILRRDRKRTITVMADPDILGEETAANLLKRVKPLIDEIPLPQGYQLEWGGEFESASKAQKAIFGSLPMGYLVMFIITVLLFNSIKKSLIIWATVPLAIIGVTCGLYIMNSPFSFMALLGLLSLSGMLIKNGIVLMDQIELELSQNKDAYDAVFHSALSRLRPVSMAAITTILGMIPLLFDVFFESMAVTIMFGLGFATVLTLLVIPALYSIVFKVKSA